MLQASAENREKENLRLRLFFKEYLMDNGFDDPSIRRVLEVGVSEQNSLSILLPNDRYKPLLISSLIEHPFLANGGINTVKGFIFKGEFYCYFEDIDIPRKKNRIVNLSPNNFDVLLSFGFSNEKRHAIYSLRKIKKFVGQCVSFDNPDEKKFYDSLYRSECGYMEKIKIMKDGPYLVTGNVPLIELIITPTSKGNIYKEGRVFKHSKEYGLCRCGHSRNKPFCDSSHEYKKFDGTSTASHMLFKDQAKKYCGNNLILEDVESLCAYARFCHAGNDDIWNLTEIANNEEEESLAIKMACECPSGRLVMYDRQTKEAIEPAFEKSIAVIRDAGQNCGGPLWVRGGIEIEDENGNILEKRNRVTLCRCGKSNNKPFCDASHIHENFGDSK